jgi:hypothetical protein
MRNLLVTLVVLGVGGYFGAKLYVQYKVAQDLDLVVKQARPFVEVEYGDVVATMSGELRVEGVKVRMPQFVDGFTIESVGVQTPGFLYLLGFDERKLEMPEHLGIALTGIRVDADADFMRQLDDLQASPAADVELTAADKCATSHGYTPGMLQRLGYHELVADVNMGFRRQRTQVVMTFGVAVEDMYDVDVELAFEGMTDPTAMVRGARPMLAGGRIDYVDRSLNSRIMKHCAEQQVSPQDVLAAQLREAHTLARETGMELDELILQPYTDFLLGKPRFTLISAPPRPIDLTQLNLYKPSDVPNLLNLTAEAG